KDYIRTRGIGLILPRAVDRILASPRVDMSDLARLLDVLATSGDPLVCARCLSTVSAKVQSGELAGARRDAIREKLQPILKGLMGASGDRGLEATVLAASLSDPEGIKLARSYFAASEQSEDTLLRVLNALVAAGDVSVLD